MGFRVRLTGGGTLALGWANRSIGIVTALALVPIVLNRLGEDHYAAYVVIQNLAPWAALATIGLGPALKNAIAEARARGEPDGPTRAAAGRILMVSIPLASMLVLLAAPSASGILMGRLDVGHAAAWKALLAGSLLLLVVAAGQVGTEALFGELRASHAFGLSSVAQLSRLGLVLLAARLATDDRDSALILLTGAAMAPLALTGVVALVLTRIGPRPSPPQGAVRRLIGTSRWFLSNAAVSSAVNNVDYLIMSQVLESRGIATYAVIMMPVQAALGLYSTVLSVEWPKWAAGFAGKGRAAVRRNVTRLAMSGLGMGLVVTLLAPVAIPPLLRAWVGRGDFQVSSGTVSLVFAYMAIRFWTDTFTVGLLAGNNAKWTTRVALVQAFIAGPAEYLLGRWIGINGIVLGLIIAQLLTAAWLNAWQFRRVAVFPDKPTTGHQPRGQWT